ncbi:MAG: hypothetical protein O7J95_16215 [Planctomycetota bacterium]|nr:hypothetical protein [Planctomycetota bacterium]
MVLVLATGCARPPESSPGEERKESGSQLRLSWENNLLTIRADDLPGGELKIWYLEAYCRGGSTDREWGETTIPHRTELVEASEDGRSLRLRCRLPASKAGGDGAPQPPGVVVDHVIRASPGKVSFEVSARNEGLEPVDVRWVQPCIRVDRFTGLGQKDYIRRSFIFTEKGLTRLDELPRAEEARYRGGQVYVPRGIDRDDVNPRPISSVVPANGLIGCFSADGEKILATAWEPYQELFQGVIVCLHSDFRLGGLGPGESRRARGKLYVVDSEEELLGRYRRDFPEQLRRESN